MLHCIQIYKLLITAVIIAQVINQMQLQEPLQRIEIYKAWDKVVGDHVAGLTTNKYFTNGRLYCKLGSSVVRSQLYFQLESIRASINLQLKENVVKEVILR